MMVLDIFPDRIEVNLFLPATALERELGHSLGAGEVQSDTRDALAVYLQGHLGISSLEKLPMAFELDRLKRSAGDLVEATLLVYPPDDVTPASLVISGDLLQDPGVRRALDVFLRRDEAEMRFGLEPLVPLGKLDYFHKSLTIERESLSGVARVSAAFATISRLLLAAWPTSLLIAFLLLRATHTSQGITSDAFACSAKSMMAFAAGIGVALLAGTTVGAAWMAAGTALLLVLFAFSFWKEMGWRKELGLVLAAGWLTGASWNGMALARGISGVDRMSVFLLIGAGFVLCAALALLVLPTFVIVARRIPFVWLRGVAVVCGVIVALQELTGFLLRQ